MIIELRNNKDFFAGLMFIVIGLGALFVTKDYPLGNAFRMGPGYFPTALGVILTAFGLYIMVRGLIKGEKSEGIWGIRAPVLITLSIVSFGFMVQSLGMVPALLAVFMISALGGHEFKFKEVLILSVVMTAIACGVFIYGLGLPYRLFLWGS